MGEVGGGRGEKDRGSSKSSKFESLLGSIPEKPEASWLLNLLLAASC
jgi:hypothetical protein